MVLVAASFGCDGDRSTGGAVSTVSNASPEPPAQTAGPQDGAKVTEKAPDPNKDFVPVERLVITGAQVLSELRQGSDGMWEAVGFDETTIVIEDGVVVRLVDATNYQLTPNDAVISARGRWVMATPIVFGPMKAGTTIADSLSGGAMIDLTLAGIGGLVVPESVLESPAGVCARHRRTGREIPSASLLGMDVQAYSDLDSEFPRVDLSNDGVSELRTWIAGRIESDVSPASILARLTVQAAEILGRSDLGRVEIGSKSDLVILDGNPLSNPDAILDPFAVTFGDRAIRRAEIEVLRDASMRGGQMRRQTRELTIDSMPESSIRRWVTSTQGQIFAGLVAAGPAGDTRFVSRVGQPRFDQSSGRIRLSPGPDTPNFELDYDGPPESFAISTKAVEAGLSIELRIEGVDPIVQEAVGPTGPPVIDLPLDLDVRRDLIGDSGTTVFKLQELLYGSGPIGLAPRRYELTPLDRPDCPPCFEGCDPVFRLEVFDPERGEDIVAAVMIIGFREGRPSRGRFETATGPIWFDELPEPGRTAID